MILNVKKKQKSQQKKSGPINIMYLPIICLIQTDKILVWPQGQKSGNYVNENIHGHKVY